VAFSEYTNFINIKVRLILIFFLIIADEYITTPRTTKRTTPVPAYILSPQNYLKISETNVKIDMPSQPLDPNQPFGEFDFKPIINPPPDFYKFKPVKANPFSNEDVIFTAPSSEASIEVLDQNINPQNIDTMSGIQSNIEL
jgi:hypothetical protein